MQFGPQEAGGAPAAGGFSLHFGILVDNLTVVMLFILLLFYFRRLHGVAIPMVAGLSTAIWGMGFCAWIGISLDPLVLVIPLLITARSISHTVQMAERFFEDYEMEVDARERELGHALTALQLVTRSRIKIRRKLREGRKLTVLCKFKPQLPGYFSHRLGLGGTAHAGDR